MTADNAAVPPEKRCHHCPTPVDPEPKDGPYFGHFHRVAPCYIEPQCPAYAERMRDAMEELAPSGVGDNA